MVARAVRRGAHPDHPAGRSRASFVVTCDRTQSTRSGERVCAPGRTLQEGTLESSGLTPPSYNRMVVSMQAIFDHDRIFAALADLTRRDIVRRAIDGEEGVAELAGHYPMSFAAVQKHVAILERAGLVTKKRIGRRKVVRTNLEGLRVARRLLDQYEELWRGRIDRMTELVTESKEADR